MYIVVTSGVELPLVKMQVHERIMGIFALTFDYSEDVTEILFVAFAIPAHTNH